MNAMSEHIDPAETEALFAFMKATVTRVEKGGLGTENALISVAIVISAWARKDPELHRLMCQTDEPPNRRG